MQRDVATKKTAEKPGLLETIAEGFSTVLYRPFLITIPVLLDLFFWLGWTFKPTALAARLVLRLGSSDGVAAAEIKRSVTDFGTWDVSGLTSFLVPSLVSGIDRTKIYTVRDQIDLSQNRWWLDLAVIVGVFIGSSLLLASYSVPLADSVLGRNRTLRETAHAIGRAWGGILGLFAALLGIAALVFAPLAVAWVALLAVDVDSGPLLGAVAALIGFAIYLASWFAPDAIVVSQASPLQAIALSATVVRRNFLETVSFIVASLVITFGLAGVWMRMGESAPGLLLAVIANSVVASALVMASLHFFNSRIRTWRPEAAFPPTPGANPQT